ARQHSDAGRGPGWIQLYPGGRRRIIHPPVDPDQFEAHGQALVDPVEEERDRMAMVRIGERARRGLVLVLRLSLLMCPRGYFADRHRPRRPRADSDLPAGGLRVLTELASHRARRASIVGARCDRAADTHDPQIDSRSAAAAHRRLTERRTG